MKKVILIVMAGLFTSCYENFRNTKSYFETEKNLYEIGEKFDLFFTLTSPGKDKKVRFFEGFLNIDIWMALKEPCNSNPTGLCMNETKYRENVERTYSYTEHLVTPEKPFIKRFTCFTEIRGDLVIISIPELSYEVTFLTKNFREETILAIFGQCLPIKPDPLESFDDYVEDFTIKLVLPK